MAMSFDSRYSVKYRKNPRKLSYVVQTMHLYKNDRVLQCFYSRNQNKMYICKSYLSFYPALILFEQSKNALTR